MTSKCCKNKKVADEVAAEFVTQCVTVCVTALNCCCYLLLSLSMSGKRVFKSVIRKFDETLISQS